MSDELAERAAKLVAFRNIWIENPRTAAVTRHLDSLRATFRATAGKPQSGSLLLAPPGSGKTRSIEVYIEASVEAGMSPRKIVYVPLQAGSTVKRFWQSFLQDAGDPLWDHGTEEKLRHRGVAILREQQTELLVIDETQQLHGGGPLRANRVADSFKRLLDDGVCPVLFSGTEDAMPLFAGNVQFVRRLAMPVDLNPLDITKEDDLGIFAHFLGELDEQIVGRRILAEHSQLFDPHMIEGIYRVSKGVVGIAHRLIELSLELALSRNAAKIERYDLWKATED